MSSPLSAPMSATFQPGLMPTISISFLNHVTGLDIWLYFLRHAEKMDPDALPAALQRPLVLVLDDLQSENSYSARAYGTSKLCNVLFTRELARRAPELRANCFHPGVVRTGFAKSEDGVWKVVAKLGAPFFRSPERGARSLVWLALSDDAAALTGEYIVDEKAVLPSAQALDDTLARSLWERSAQLVNLPMDARD